MEEERNIQLPGGFKLNVQMTPEFLVRVRHHYELPENAIITDDHLQRFLIETMKVALDGVRQ